MRALRSLPGWHRDNGADDEDGAAIFIALAFVMIFLIVGVALYWLITSQIRSTDTERTDVKSFNVAEAGIDAGMLTLKLGWPAHQTDPSPTVDDNLLKATIKAGTQGLWDPRNPSDFIKVAIYDNVDASGNTTTIPNPDPSTRVYWDSNGDGKMFVDSTADVGNDRHRIFILAQAQTWNLTFPLGLALFANSVDSNGQGLSVSIEDGSPPVYYDVNDVQHKGITASSGVDTTPNPTSFSNIVSPALQNALQAIANNEGTYFTNGTDASNFLASGQANGKVVYVKSDTSVTISGNTQIGTVDDPVVIVIDTPNGTVNGWDLTGTGDFYGVLITIGDSTLRGTSGIHGALFCSGTVSNKGTGASGEINYNQQVINNLNGQYVISVNIVPNTWEEYSVPVTTGGT